MRPTSPTETAPLVLVEAAAKRDDAFEELARRCEGLRVRALAGLFLPGGESSDLAQAALIGLHLAVETFEPGRGASFETFAFLCMRRQAITFVKAATRGKQRPLNGALSLNAPVGERGEQATLAEVLPAPANGQPHERAVARAQLGDAANFLRRELSPLERNSVILCRVRGESLGDAAHALNVTEKAIDNALQRARDKASRYRPPERRPAKPPTSLASFSMRRDPTKGRTRPVEGDQMQEPETPAFVPDDWDERTLREARERRERLVARIEALSGELAEAEAALPRVEGVIAVLEGQAVPLPVVAEPEAETVEPGPAPAAEPEAEGEPEPEADPLVAAVERVARELRPRNSLLAAILSRVKPRGVEDGVLTLVTDGLRASKLEEPGNRVPVERALSRELNQDLTITVVVDEEAERARRDAEERREARVPAPRKPGERKAPTWPGIDEVPEELREVPAAQKAGPLPQRIAAARKQVAVLEAVRGRPTSIAGEIAKATGINPANVGSHLRDLEQAKLVKRTGRNRHALDLRRRPGQHPGRASVEYAPCTPSAEPAPEPAPAPPPPAPPAPPRAVEPAPPAGDKYSAAVLGYIAEHPGAVAAEIGDDLGFDSPRVSVALKALRESGAVVQGDKRMRRGATSGRPAVTYRVAVGGPAPVAPAPPSGTGPSMEQVRDAVTALGPERQFSPGQLARDKGWRLDEVRARLDALAARGVVADESPTTDLALFRYMPPSAPGRAAVLDAARRPSEPAGRASGGVAVAGTGKGLQVSNADVRALIRAAEAAGATVTHAPNGHFAVAVPGGKRVLIAATPRGTRGVMNDRGRLRKAGLSV